MRRAVLVVFSLAGALAAGGCATSSGGYGSGGDFGEYYDDCYDGYCVGYNAYGRAYRRTQEPVARDTVDRVDRSHGTTQTVSRSGVHPTSSSSTSSARMSVSRPAPAPPAPSTVSRH